MAIVDLSGKWIKVNKSLCEMVGYSESEMSNLTFQDITHPDDLEIDLENIRRLLRKEIPSYQLEKRYFKKSGDILHILLSVSLICDTAGKPQFFISQIQDFSKVKNYEQELLKLASEDYLTRIGNRRFFYEQASREIKRSARSEEPLTLLLIDIDHFKNVNDTYGHEVGDGVLQQIASISKNSIRSIDIIGRIGGEEFAILLLDTDYEGSHTTAERLRNNIANTDIKLRGNLLRTTVSIGAVTFWGDSKTIDFRLHHADEALYRAKNLGRNRVEYYIDPEDIYFSPSKLYQTGLIHLQWSKRYESGNQTIDSQHHYLFQLSNRLLSAIIAGESKEHCLNLINALVEHVKEHFKDESEIFLTANYEESDNHLKIHDKLLNQCNELAEKYQHDALSLGEVLVFLASEVIHNHMIIEDKKFFKCI
jgi:diguanylate cyclase (GGDEF)-like protein/hemerythrin-like metal-binding protein/PAS domain S-box-containing protein